MTTTRVRGVRHLRATCNYYTAVTSVCLRQVVALVHAPDGGHQWLCEKHNDLVVIETVATMKFNLGTYEWVETLEEALAVFDNRTEQRR